MKNKEKTKKEEKAPLAAAGTKSKISKKKNKAKVRSAAPPVDRSDARFKSSQEQSSWFFSTFQTAHRGVLSALEMGAFPDEAMVEVSGNPDHSIQKLAVDLKGMVGSSWEDRLCAGSLGELEPGSPVVLFVSSSALRCVDLLKSVSSLTKECKPGKLFAKHFKVDEQVAALKQRVNIAAGTPNRLKKLIDIGALGLSRLSFLVLDMQKDAKGFTLLTVPQVSGEFWDLYRLHFHSGVVESRFRMCLY